MSFIGIVFCFHAWVFFLFVFGCGILAPQLGTEPVPPVVGVQSPNPTGAAREIPSYTLLTYMICKNGFFFSVSGTWEMRGWVLGDFGK